MLVGLADEDTAIDDSPVEDEKELAVEEDCAPVPNAPAVSAVVAEDDSVACV